MNTKKADILRVMEPDPIRLGAYRRKITECELLTSSMTGDFEYVIKNLTKENSFIQDNWKPRCDLSYISEPTTCICSQNTFNSPSGMSQCCYIEHISGLILKVGSVCVTKLEVSNGYEPIIGEALYRDINKKARLYRKKVKADRLWYENDYLVNEDEYILFEKQMKLNELVTIQVSLMSDIIKEEKKIQTENLRQQDKDLRLCRKCYIHMCIQKQSHTKTNPNRLFWFCRDCGWSHWV